MGAQLRGNPSFIWRSILVRQRVLQLGFARHIGDGLDTKIWGWNWLAESTNEPLSTLCAEHLWEARVNGLLDDQGRWDEGVVCDIFLAVDVKRVLATLVNIHFKDSWRWVGDIRGRYTVKHGYQLLTHGDMQPVEPGSFQAWKALWALLIPPKIKNFLWRCAASPRQPEIEKVDDVQQGRGLLNFMDSTIGSSSTPAAVKLAAVFWTVWLTRNDVIWHNKSLSVEEARERIKHLQESWETAYSTTARSAGVTGRTDNWTPSPLNTIKCKIDAPTFATGAGYGAVIRDHGGHFVAAKSGWFEGVSDPYLAEVLAAKEALAWIQTQGRSNCLLETDCLRFCNAFNSRNVDFSYVGLIVKQCLSIANDMGTVKATNVRRIANRVAHELARATVSESVSKGGHLSHRPSPIY
ncbi:PREDICTED: uncharacterized protein LOC109179181 [Ipomoea nil]|uniref:uncharacterized protein LOC109179181 n=1 Tax=Ipomoea nil TaxID=35883 RepID=UPI000900B458|nr:PREDICTED: uncharacterized protein LOC109179181 [Ipomoea nil]